MQVVTEVDIQSKLEELSKMLDDVDSCASKVKKEAGSSRREMKRLERAC